MARRSLPIAFLWYSLRQGRKDPYLYKVISRLLADGKVIDEVVQPLGVRRYEIVPGKGFYLNGEKYPMYGVTRHQDWWGLGSALTNKEHDFDLAQIMDIGLLSVSPTINSRITCIPVAILWDWSSGQRFLL